MNIKEQDTSKNQWLSQIIIPFAGCFLLIIFSSYTIINKGLNLEFNLRMMGDISSSFLILLILPSMIFTLALIILLIFLINKIIKQIKIVFPKLQSISNRINNGINSICEMSVRPLFFFESFQTILRRNKKD